MNVHSHHNCRQKFCEVVIIVVVAAIAVLLVGMTTTMAMTMAMTIQHKSRSYFFLLLQLGLVQCRAATLLLNFSVVSIFVTVRISHGRKQNDEDYEVVGKRNLKEHFRNEDAKLFMQTYVCCLYVR